MRRFGVANTGMKVKKGFTLIELAVLIGAMVVLGAFAMMSYTGMEETRDASMVQSVQASLQAVVSQAATRMDTSPDKLQATNVINAVKVNIPSNVTLSNNYRLSFTSGRGAQFAITPNGDIQISQLINFTRFTVGSDGTIKKL